MSSSDEEMLVGTPPELAAEAKLAMANLLPSKSSEKYLKTYENFVAWRKQKNTDSFSENIMLAYFSELSKDKKPSTLWAIYSMLKSTIQLKHNINIKSYTNLTSFLKRQSAGFKGKKSKILTDENISMFLNEAPDDMFLVTKVALIFGVNGACRMIELTNLTLNDVTSHDDILLVTLRDTKTRIDRTFVIRQEYVPLVKKYQELRPKTIKSDRFFINYKNGKCTNQVIGRHKMAGMPSQIAKYLNLPDSDGFTGHCFRRSSATLLADSGANLTTLKRHGGWKSCTVAESYIEVSVQNKKNIAEKINQSIKLSSPITEPSTSSTVPQHMPPCPSNPLSDDNVDTSCSNSNQNFNISNTPTTAENIQTTCITVPGKTITLNFNNCPNMSNVSNNIN